MTGLLLAKHGPAGSIRSPAPKISGSFTSTHPVQSRRHSEGTAILTADLLLRVWH